MKLSAPVLTAAHGFLDLLFDIVIAVIYIFLGSMTGQVQYRFLTVMVFLSFQELMNEIVILLPDLFRYRCCIISPFPDIAFCKAGNETCNKSA